MEYKIKETTILLSPEDYDYVIQWKWQRESRYNGRHTTNVKRMAPSTTVKRLDNRKGVRKTLYLNRVVYERCYGPIPKGLRVIQKVTPDTPDTLDYQRENLQLATASASMSQIKKNHSRDLTSQYKGVYMVESEAKWRAAITHMGIKYFIGRYDDERDAALAYDRKALELDPQFKVLNFESSRT